MKRTKTATSNRKLASAALVTALLTTAFGCGGNVEVEGNGGAGGQGGAAGTGASGTTASTATDTFTETFSETFTSPPAACEGFAPGTFFVDGTAGNELFHLEGECPYSMGNDGPSAYAWTNGKSGPEWYFEIDACPGPLSEGSPKPALHMVVPVPEQAMVSVPYSTEGEIVYTKTNGAQLDPATSTEIIFNELSPPYGIVSGEFFGTVIGSDGQPTSLSGKFLLCRREDVIFI